MAVNDILEIGRQGLNTSKQALQTTSNNIANANTPGYSRRRAQIETNPMTFSGGQQLGGGVQVSKVMRVHDDFVQKQIVDEAQALGSLKMQAEVMQRLESTVMRDGEHISELVNKFFNDYRELSSSPETASLRTVVGSSADALGAGIRRMNDSFEGMKRELDLRIGDVTDQINMTTREIAGLNNTIAESEARGEVPNDLYDRRDSLVRNLSSKVDVAVTPDQRGQITVISGGAVLVQGTDTNELSVARTPETEAKTPGQVDVYIKTAGGGERPITRLIKQGELGGMIRVRDEVIGQSQGQLDKIAYHIAKSVNGVHSKGVGVDGTSGRNMFKDLGDDAKGAAFRFGISEDVGKSFEGVAIGTSGAAGDNEIALAIADLQNLKGLASTNVADAGHTINESLNALVGKIGVETQRDQSFFNHQQSVVDQLENYRQSISGVSLEEEAVNMIQYQTVFNASAKAMKVGSELFETILSLKD